MLGMINIQEKIHYVLTKFSFKCGRGEQTPFNHQLKISNCEAEQPTCDDLPILQTLLQQKLTVKFP